MAKFPKEFLERLEAVKSRRAKTVIDHILKHGSITTEELRDVYGYDHPPRAARDVREEGIPLETIKVTGSHGRRIGAYKFGEISAVKGDRLSGRIAWPKKFKKDLLEQLSSRCGICSEAFDPRYLQIDHRVPFEVAGDSGEELKIEDFMLLCASCNRKKSWSCEQCTNWKGDRLIEACQTCYWAVPDNYIHIALEIVRRLEIVWKDDEISDYDHLVKLAEGAEKDLSNLIKDQLHKHVTRDTDDEKE